MYQTLTRLIILICLTYFRLICTTSTNAKRARVRTSCRRAVQIPDPICYSKDEGSTGPLIEHHTLPHPDGYYISPCLPVDGKECDLAHHSNADKFCFNQDAHSNHGEITLKTLKCLVVPTFFSKEETLWKSVATDRALDSQPNIDCTDWTSRRCTNFIGQRLQCQQPEQLGSLQLVCAPDGRWTAPPMISCVDSVQIREPYCSSVAAGFRVTQHATLPYPAVAGSYIAPCAVVNGQRCRREVDEITEEKKCFVVTVDGHIEVKTLECLSQRVLLDGMQQHVEYDQLTLIWSLKANTDAVHCEEWLNRDCSNFVGKRLDCERFERYRVWTEKLLCSAGATSVWQDDEQWALQQIQQDVLMAEEVTQRLRQSRDSR